MALFRANTRASLAVSQENLQDKALPSENKPNPYVDFVWPGDWPGAAGWVAAGLHMGRASSSPSGCTTQPSCNGERSET